MFRKPIMFKAIQYPKHLNIENCELWIENFQHLFNVQFTMFNAQYSSKKNLNQSYKLSKSNIEKRETNIE